MSEPIYHTSTYDIPIVIIAFNVIVEFTLMPEITQLPGTKEYGAKNSSFHLNERTSDNIHGMFLWLSVQASNSELREDCWTHLY